MKFFGLRAKIVGVFVGLYGLFFILLLGWIVDHTQSDFLSEVDQSLHRSVAEITEAVHRGDENIDSLRNAVNALSRIISHSRYISLSRGDSLLLVTDGFPDETQLRHSAEGIYFTTVAQGDNWFRVAHSHHHDLSLHVAEEISATRHVLSETGSLIVFSIPLVILISIVAGYFLVSRLLKPLDDVVAMARRISSQSLHERIPVPESEDEVHRLVQTLNEMIERLEQSFSRMEQFAANAAHELRTPLTILKGELEVGLQQSRSAEEYKEILLSNLEEVRRIAKTVENLFMLTNIDSKVIEIEREPVDLPLLLEEICSAANVLASAKHVTISLDAAPGIEIEGDVVLLMQLFLNLVDNAIKYNRPGGWVNIGLKSENGKALVTFADSGIGIPEEEHKHIFDRFYRVDKQMSRREGGAGLGLSLALWIVDMHKGSIALESSPGSGSTFTVSLPV